MLINKYIKTILRRRRWLEAVSTWGEDGNVIRDRRSNRELPRNYGLMQSRVRVQSPNIFLRLERPCPPSNPSLCSLLCHCTRPTRRRRAPLIPISICPPRR
jgi:hypothetical protein